MFNLPLHPALVHIPLGAAFLSPLLMVALIFLIWKKVLPKKSWALAVALQAVIVAGGFVAMNAGERDEKPVKKILNKSLIHEHEEKAEVFVWTSAGVLGLSAAALFVPAGPMLAAGTILSTVGAAGALGLALQTGHSGGELVFRYGAARAFEASSSLEVQPLSNAPAPAGDVRHGDDD